MKKFFKILGKIIKILLKTILWLILGIIVIGGIILLIINNKTLKFYEDEKGNTIGFTTKKSFVIEDGKEYYLSLKKGSFTYKHIHNGNLGVEKNYKILYNSTEGLITYSDYLDNRNNGNSSTEVHIKLKNGNIYVKLYGDGYLESDNIVKLNLPNISSIKNSYKNGDIENLFEILRFFVNGKEIDYYDNGQISDKRNFINGLENGSYISYYENGQIEKEGKYINGENDGYWTGYYKNGNIRYKGKYNNGLENGYGINFYKNGNIYNEGNYINGYVDGILTGYFENGNIKYIYNYNNGKLDGKSIIYNEDGSYEDIEADNGIGIRTIYNENDNIKLKYGFITDEENNLLLNGKLIRYFENGKITEGNYINGKKNGPRTGYYKDGSLRFLGNFEDGLGIISYFDENGNLIGTGEEFDEGYQAYTKNGLNISLYENGQIASMCNYLDGAKNGSCTIYYENGQIREDSQYYDIISSTDGNIYELGNFNYYDELGNFIGSGEIKCLEKYDGSFKFYTNDDYDKLCSILNFNGFFFTYYPSFKIKQIEYLENYTKDRYIHNKNNGYYIKYYENGNIQEKGNYNDGNFTYFYENGNIMREMNYKINKDNSKLKELDGKRVEYFEDGNIYSEGNYDNGKRVGTRNWYLGDGSIGVSKNYDE